MSARLKTVGNYVRFALLLAWAAVIILAVGFYLSDPSRFTASNIAAFISTFQTEIWIVYLTMSVLRGLTLLPSTPLVLAGTILYPDRPWLVLSTALVGILISSSMIYFFSEALGFSDYFENKKPRAVAKIRRQLERPTGFIFISLWAFFPLVPTDAVCYVAGTTKMNFLKFVLAVFLGEFVLCGLYVFWGGLLIGRWF